MFVRNHNTYILVFPLELFIKSIVCWLYSLFWILIWSPSNAVQWGLCYWFCICVHCHFSVGFVLLILDLCSLPVFSGVCVIDSVYVFTASFQWGLCNWFCILNRVASFSSYICCLVILQMYFLSFYLAIVLSSFNLW